MQKHLCMLPILVISSIYAYKDRKYTCLIGDIRYCDYLTYIQSNCITYMQMSDVNYTYNIKIKIET